MTIASLKYNNQWYDKRVTTPPPSSCVPLWRMKPSTNPREAATKAAQEQGQNSHGFPDIISLRDGVKNVQLTQAWQLFIAAINPRMDKRRVAGLLGDAVAFTNGTGFGDTPRRNYLTGENLNAQLLPTFDKVRTCSYACHTGTVEGEFLRLLTLDGNLQPPSIADVNPLSHPHLFFHATIVYMSNNGVELTRVPFENKRAVAPEWGYDFEVTIMPLVSCVEILRPLKDVERVSAYSLPYYKYP